MPDCMLKRSSAPSPSRQRSCGANPSPRFGSCWPSRQMRIQAVRRSGQSGRQIAPVPRQGMKMGMRYGRCDATPIRSCPCNCERRARCACTGRKRRAATGETWEGAYRAMTREPGDLPAWVAQCLGPGNGHGTEPSVRATKAARPGAADSRMTSGTAFARSSHAGVHMRGRPRHVF